MNKYETEIMLNDLAYDIRTQNEKWWRDIETGEPLERNVGELIALAHSELSEALEAHRKNLWMTSYHFAEVLKLNLLIV